MIFELPGFEYIDVKSVEEATCWAQKYGEHAALLGGGTDLFGLMKDRVQGPRLSIPKLLIDVKTIPEFNQINFNEKGDLTIGAAVTLSRLMVPDSVKDFDILQQTARQIGTTQIRNVGTVGGNICQRPQCLYFRHPQFLCYKKGGSKCFAVTGDHRYYHSVVKYGKCVMAHPSDMALALVALGAQATIAGSDGEKRVPLDDFFVGPNHHKETILKPGELITAIHIPRPAAGTHQTFVKQRIRHSTDFALVSIAAVATMSHKTCEKIRIVMGGIAPFPFVASDIEAMLKEKRLSEALIAEAAEAFLHKARPLSMNGYKIDLSKTLLRRVLNWICDQAA